MGGGSKDGEDTIKIRRPRRRVRTPIKTGTVVHKSPKTYTRREKHKKKPEENRDD